MSPSASYAEFRENVFDHHIMSEEFISCDISDYFNHIYHHDLQAWFAALEPTKSEDVEAFGKYLREINAGRSLDCLPQGLYPAKMIGNDFLRFVEKSSTIRAPRIARFMDDIVFLGDTANDLIADFNELQRLLGLKGLTVHSKKTRFGGTPITGEVDEHLSDLKKGLLRLRRRMLAEGYEEDESIDDEDAEPLEQEQIELVRELLGSGRLGEDDAELIMVVMRDHVSLIEDHLSLFARGYPHLAKSLTSAVRLKTKKRSLILYWMSRNKAHTLVSISYSGSEACWKSIFWIPPEQATSCTRCIRTQAQRRYRKPKF